MMDISEGITFGRMNTDMYHRVPFNSIYAFHISRVPRCIFVYHDAGVSRLYETTMKELYQQLDGRFIMVNRSWMAKISRFKKLGKKTKEIDLLYVDGLMQPLDCSTGKKEVRKYFEACRSTENWLNYLEKSWSPIRENPPRSI